MSAFGVVLRGYDRGEVDRLVSRIGRGEAVPEELERPRLRVRLRGYDRGQVDMYLEVMAKRIRGTGPH
jgi:cell division septum initiation protein DivIVA